MKTQTKHKFFTDGSHGWLKVSKKRLEKLGIADKITGCSFMRGEQTYLEEDCDLSTYIKALFKLEGIEGDSEAQNGFMKEFWSNCEISDTSCSNRSVIRGYSSYLFYTPELQAKADKLRKLILDNTNFNKNGRNQIKNGSLDDLIYWKEYYNL